MQISNNIHELIQTYLEKLYQPLSLEVNQALFGFENEIYGELYYYSVVKILNYLNITESDHFLDIGSGFGKLIFQLFLTTSAKKITGIEINNQRYLISTQIQHSIEHQLPKLFYENHMLSLIEGDFLNYDLTNPSFNDVTIAYTCSTVFSYPLLLALSEKINEMENVHTVISLRKLPNLHRFILYKKIFVQGTWDVSACYFYRRKKVRAIL